MLNPFWWTVFSQECPHIRRRIETTFHLDLLSMIRREDPTKL
jgi:hypothetical protein